MTSTNVTIVLFIVYLNIHNTKRHVENSMHGITTIFTIQ